MSEARSTPEVALQLEDRSGVESRWVEGPEGGRLARIPLALPPYRRACYFAPFQKYAIDPALDLWPEGYNQCHPLAVDRLAGVKRGGMFALLHLENGGFLALLPLVTAETMASFTGVEDGLRLDVDHWGTAAWSGEAPILAWARDGNLYAAAETAWRRALEHPALRGRTRLRTEKHYPDLLGYLGWCTWEEYKLAIDEQVILSALTALAEADCPIQWVLIDDGHLEYVEEQSAATRAAETAGEGIQPHRRLTGFGVDRDRFPRGWAPIREAASELGFRGLGIWLNLKGYWGGIARENRLGPLNDHLVDLATGVRHPAPNPASTAALYSAMIEPQRQAEFDFVKVDNQAGAIALIQGEVENAVYGAGLDAQALETACHDRGLGLINCMAHNNVCLFNTRESAVTRCSEDYLLENAWRAKLHLHNSYSNMVLLGHTVWGDHDMFHSSDRLAAEVMALSKALSGGPVYLSDAPDRLRPERVRPLCYADGALLRPLAPAVPLPESVFLDPYAQAAAYRVMAPLAQGCVVIAAYNLTEPERPVSGTVQAADYRAAGGMLQDGQPAWALPPQGLVAYDVREGTAKRLGGDGIDFRIPSFGHRCWILCPIREGWAMPGRADKVLGPAALRDLTVETHRITLRLVEDGPLRVWCEQGAPVCDGTPMSEVGCHLWQADLAIGPGGHHVIEKGVR